MFRILVSCGKGWADPENPVPNERKEKKSTELPVEEAEKPNSTHRYWNAYSCMTSARWPHCTQCKQGLPNSCRLVDVVLEHRLLTPRPCHPPRSLPTWHRVNCSMKHLIVIWQIGAAFQRRQLSMARYLRLNQPTYMQTVIPEIPAKDSNGIISATFRSQPYRVRERQASSLLVVPGLMSLSTSHHRCCLSVTPRPLMAEAHSDAHPARARFGCDYLSWIIRQHQLSTLHGFTDSTTTGVVACAY